MLKRPSPSLVTVRTFSIKAGLASYKQPDPKTLVFAIQPGARFWDGKPVTPADVVYSLQRNLDPKVQSPAAAAFRFVASIKPTGAHAVTIERRHLIAVVIDELARVEPQQPPIQAFTGRAVGHGLRYS